MTEAQRCIQCEYLTAAYLPDDWTNVEQLCWIADQNQRVTIPLSQPLKQTVRKPFTQLNLCNCEHVRYTHSSLRNVKSSVSARGVDFLNRTCSRLWQTSAEFSMSSSASTARRSPLYVFNHASTRCVMHASRTDSVHKTNSVVLQSVSMSHCSSAITESAQLVAVLPRLLSPAVSNYFWHHWCCSKTATML